MKPCVLSTLAVLCFLSTLAPTFATAACSNVTIDFEAMPDGTPLLGGAYLKDEYFQAYGLVLSASGGFSKKPCLFNTSDIQDSDLGSPNQQCTPPGPGVGKGGEPDMPGANCKPQHNVLIIQQDDEEQPVANQHGGSLVFTFTEKVTLNEIGLMDIGKVGTNITAEIGDATQNFPVIGLGNNAVQTETIHLPRVSKLSVHFMGRSAVTFVTCSNGVWCRGSVF